MFNFVATQLLTDGAMDYSASAIVMPAEESPLSALEQARDIAVEDGAQLLSSDMAEALRNLQIGAIAFTVEATISNYRVESADFRQLEESLVEQLQRQGAVRLSLDHNLIVAAQSLGLRAIDYAREIVAAEDNNAPIGSAAAQRALSNLQLAAIAFATRLAITEGQEPQRLRRIEKKLVTIFEHQESPS